MEWVTIVNELFTVVLIPLLGLVTKYFIEFVHAKRDEVKDKINNEKINKYINMLDTTITKAVIATNQTYVEALKAQGNFDKDAQIEALNRTRNAVLATLTEEAQMYLQTAIGDIEEYIRVGIEAAVNEQKK